MLYQPRNPIQYCNLNPRGYRNPSERNLLYKDIEAVGADGVKIRGWFIHHPNPVSRKTILFMHENAGNIGLRLDYYELIYH